MTSGATARCLVKLVGTDARSADHRSRTGSHLQQPETGRTYDSVGRKSDLKKQTFLAIMRAGSAHDGWYLSTYDGAFKNTRKDCKMRVALLRKRGKRQPEDMQGDRMFRAARVGWTSLPLFGPPAFGGRPRTRADVATRSRRLMVGSAVHGAVRRCGCIALRTMRPAADCACRHITRDGPITFSVGSWGGVGCRLPDS